MQLYTTYPAWKIRPSWNSLTKVSKNTYDNHTGLQTISSSLETQKPTELTLEILKISLDEKRLKYHCSMEAQIKIKIMTQIGFNELPFTAVFYARVSI
jgi:hypothetical protein